MRPGSFVTSGAVAALVVHLVVLRNLWDPTRGQLVTWLVLEAVVAVAIGVAAPRGGVVAAGVLGGWLLQAVYFAVVTPKDDTHNLWAVGLVELAFLGAVALGLALLAHLITRRIRLRSG
ncbi:MAG TPA: hypothetical protein VK402_12190 [Blastococcus sp.]|nr:hypothetical protein [Blastococcus sp.]